MANFEISYTERTITLTKKFAKAAGVLGTREFNILKQLREACPDYTVQVREIAKKENKVSYANLTYKFMNTFCHWLKFFCQRSQCVIF